ALAVDLDTRQEKLLASLGVVVDKVDDRRLDGHEAIEVVAALLERLRLRADGRAQLALELVEEPLDGRGSVDRLLLLDSGQPALPVDVQGDGMNGGAENERAPHQPGDDPEILPEKREPDGEGLARGEPGGLRRQC